jgi:hypothetical protein
MAHTIAVTSDQVNPGRTNTSVYCLTDQIGRSSFFLLGVGCLLKVDTTRLPIVAWWINGGLAATAMVMMAIAAGSSRTIVLARPSDAHPSEQVAHGDLDHTRAV